jgi:hypothetical protein
MAVGNVNGPLALGEKSVAAVVGEHHCPSLRRLLIVPPIVNVLSAQVMTTLMTSRSATVPLPLCTEHDCAGALGCVLTVTL